MNSLQVADEMGESMPTFKAFQNRGVRELELIQESNNQRPEALVGRHIRVYNADGPNQDKEGLYLVFRVALMMMHPMDYLNVVLEIMEKDVSI